MKPVEKSNKAEADIELLMMCIMIPSQTAKEGKAGVNRGRFQQRESEEHPHRHDMGAEHDGRDDDR
jgi:hypothetical protein